MNVETKDLEISSQICRHVFMEDVSASEQRIYPKDLKDGNPSQERMKFWRKCLKTSKFKQIWTSPTIRYLPHVLVESYPDCVNYIGISFQKDQTTPVVSL